MKYIELFAGIGGMGKGLMDAGMECVGYCEIDKYAHKAFQILHDPEERMWNAYDVRGVTDDDLRLLGGQHKINLIAGGFPCQSFSIAGKRQSFADATRGTLFFEIIRFAKILKPEHLLLENVKGLLNIDGGRAFATIICALDELGYDCEWQLLNSKNYVPQNRERIFIVGHLRGSGGRKVFPFGGENGEALRELTKGEADANRVYDGDGIARTLKGTKGGGGAKTGWYTVQSVPMLMQPRTVLTPDREEKRQNGRRFKEPGEPMFTLTAQDKHGIAIIDTRQHIDSRNGKGPRVYTDMCPTLNGTDYKEPKKVTDGYRVRKLTPLECFRLQSFPDEWYYKLKEHNISDSQLYKMAGNAVTSVVAYEIGKRLMNNGHSF